jgi:hypothetical protein
MTLLELVAALAIAGFAILGAILLLDQVDDSTRRITHDAAGDNRDGNGERMLRRLLADAQTTLDTTSRFRGDERSAEFKTLCDTPSGWAEPCHVQLAIDSLGDSSAVMAQFDNGEQYTLRRHAGRVEFRYFDMSVGDSVWRRRWGTSITLPGAIGVIVGFDTLVAPLGPARE